MEVILNSYAKREAYYGEQRFYFILDIVATLSLIPDIGWIWHRIAGEGQSINSAALRAGRISRAGTRAVSEKRRKASYLFIFIRFQGIVYRSFF